MSFLDHFEHIEDNRADINEEYELLDMVFLTIPGRGVIWSQRLDVTFREDESQIYAEDGTKNMTLFRRALLNLIKTLRLKTVWRTK